MAIEISVSIDAGSAIGVLEAAKSKIKSGIEAGVSEGGEIVVSDAKAQCPVRTGALRASINKEASGMTCVISANTEYAAYVEFGTCKMAAQPYLVPALLGNVGAIEAAVAAHVVL